MIARCSKKNLFVSGFLLGVAFVAIQTGTPSAGEGSASKWGGQVTAQAFVSWPGKDSIFSPLGTGSLYDGNLQFRLKNDLFLSDDAFFITHYEAVLSGGDTRRKTEALGRLFPLLSQERILPGRLPDDEGRLFDLTKAVKEEEQYILYHRLDRFYLGLQPTWGFLLMGRQAVTWGNGLVFNPMDLFNPFAPTDIERDYKIGDDMIFMQFPLSEIGDVQVLYLPRRDTGSGDVTWNRSSLAGKIHFPWNTAEFDVMVSKHYKDAVVGFGSTGYIGDAAWRLDATWTFLGQDGGNSDYLSLVANVDYSWVLGRKNFYGFLELFINGLGSSSYSEAIIDPDIATRLERGDLFVLGRAYVSGHVTAEVHPLVNLVITVITNLADPSGIFQPRAVWDVAQSVQVTAGGNLYYGERGSEFGGFQVPGSGLFAEPANSSFLWVTYYF